MSAGSSDTLRDRQARVLLAALCTLSTLAPAPAPAHARAPETVQPARHAPAPAPAPAPQAAPKAAPADSLDARLAEIRELNRYIPEKSLDRLLAMAPEARAAALPLKAEYLMQLSLAHRGSGQLAQAMNVADELLALGRAKGDNVAIAKGLLTKGYISSRMNKLEESHQQVWEGEKIANTTTDMALRVQAAITSGQAFTEDGNFPAALGRMQGAMALAREYGQPVQMVMALNALAILYGKMKEYDKGFEALEEAVPLAEKTNSLGRLSTLKDTEYGLAVETNQPQRGLRALLAGLEYERRIGAEAMIAASLANLSDSYLKQLDYKRSLAYGLEALDAARRMNNPSTEATAHLNIGQSYLGMGRTAEGKRSFEAGLAWFEKLGDKPELQAVLMEYGAALERAGDMPGAIRAYHRERALSNELFEMRRQKATLELQEKYETEKKQRQIELLSRENQVASAELANRRLQQRVWWLLAAVFALAAAMVGMLYRKVRHANAQLKVKNLELKRQSSRDPLTGLYNRRHFQEFMRTHQQVEKRGAGTSGEEIVGALFLLDVDHFKHINDGYGHAAGDAVLKMIADSLREILRETDMIVRWGGEEFLAFLPAIPRSGVEEVARRLLTGISAQAVAYQDNQISVNVSLGFAPFPLVPGEHPLPWERAVNLVDMALYLAKAHGRNRAYGVRGFANFGQTSMEKIEQDLELAWRSGFVDLAIVLGDDAVRVAPPRLTAA